MTFIEFLTTKANGVGIDPAFVIGTSLEPLWHSEFRNFMAKKVTITNYGSGYGVTAYGEQRDADTQAELYAAIAENGDPTRVEKTGFQTRYFWDL